MDPSAVSLSPTSVQMWNGARHSRFAASAIPTAIGMPCPSEPVATSTHGSTGVGWPCTRAPSFRNCMSSRSSIAPAARNTA